MYRLQTALCSLVVFLRLLWRRLECHHCVCCLLPSRQQLWGLQLHHGKPLPVRDHFVCPTSSQRSIQFWHLAILQSFKSIPLKLKTALVTLKLFFLLIWVNLFINYPDIFYWFVSVFSLSFSLSVSFSVSFYPSFSPSFPPQICCEQPWAAGGGRLHDCLHEWSDSSQEDARHQLVEEMLPDDWQEVRPGRYQLILQKWQNLI